jgi:hypothetical protein
MLRNRHAAVAGEPRPDRSSGLFNFTDILPEIGILGHAGDRRRSIRCCTWSPIRLPPGFQQSGVSIARAVLVDGHEMFGGPVQIAASVPGTGAGSNNGTIAFDAYWQLQRPGLMLANGVLYIAFGSHADAGNYQGWMLAYNPSTLKRRLFSTARPTGGRRRFGIRAARPRSTATGDVFAATGNGDWDGVSNFGESCCIFPAPIFRCWTGTLRRNGAT